MQQTNFHDQTDLINKIAILLKRLQQGDEQAFADLYDVTASYIVLMIRNSKVDEMDQEDLLQEIYCAIYTSVSTLQECQAGLAWIKRIANNKIVDYSRKKYKEEQHRVLFFEREDNESESEPINDLFEMPEDVVDNKETQRIVRETLAELPESQYRVLFAFYFNNMSINEIAELMDMNPNTVKTNLRRAKESFKESVEVLQKKEGITLRSLPLGIILFLLYAKDESIYAAVAVERMSVLEVVKKISSKTNALSPAKSQTGVASKTANQVVGGAFSKWTLRVALVAVGFVGGVTAMYLSKVISHKQNVGSIIVTESKTDKMVVADTTEHFDIEEASSQHEEAQDAFEEYVSQQRDIRGCKIQVDIVNGEYDGEYSAQALPDGMLGYKIDDFDQDGSLELLMISGQNGNRLYPEDEIVAEELDTKASMYEYVAGKVELSDSAECGLADVRANELMHNWLVFGKKKYILQETYIAMSAISDGYYTEFSLLKYDGEKFELIQDGKFEGSSQEEDQDYINSVKKMCKKLHLVPKNMPDDIYDDKWNVMWELSSKSYYSSYLRKKDFVAQIITKNIISSRMIQSCHEKMWNGDIDAFHVAEGSVNNGEWEDFKAYLDEKWRRELDE